MMAAVRNRDNKAEVLLRKQLWNTGLRYRLHTKNLVGRPDMVFASARLVVFVDGDFWHARGLVEDGEKAFRSTLRTARQDWWVAKLRRNAERDAEVNALLESEGWRVLRFWESEVHRDLRRVASIVTDAVQSR
jgi:DNA mismatch endonuclease (patch repair protein)